MRDTLEIYLDPLLKCPPGRIVLLVPSSEPSSAWTRRPREKPHPILTLSPMPRPPTRAMAIIYSAVVLGDPNHVQVPSVLGAVHIWINRLSGQNGLLASTNLIACIQQAIGFHPVWPVSSP